MSEPTGQSGIPSTPVLGGAATMLQTEHPASTPPAATPPTTQAPPAAAVQPPANGTVPWKDGEVWTINGNPWWDSIPEADVRETVKAKQYANPAVQAMAYSNLLKLQTGNPDVLVVPGKDATPEQQAAFDQALRTRTGVPETPDKYDIKLGDNPDPKFAEFGKNVFHEIGLPPAKAQLLVDKWNTFVQTTAAERQAKEATDNDTEITALETRWGPELQQNLAAGRTAMTALGLSADLVEKIEGKVGTAPIVELLATLGRKMGEAGLQGVGTPTGVGETPETMTKDAAQARISALQVDQEFQKAYMDKNHPEHKAKLEFMERLHKRASAAT